MINGVPHFSVTQTCVEVSRRIGVGEKGVGHVVERLRQSASEFLPRCAASRAEDVSLSLAVVVRFHRAGREGDVPYLRAGGVGGDGPTVMPIQSGAGLTPRPAAIAAEGRACARAAALVH